MADLDLEEARDLQEARSVQYVAELRLALLTSGRWAVFYDNLAQVEIMGVLDEGWLRSVGETALAKRREYWEEYEVRRERLQAEPSQVMEKSLEEMGL